MLLGMSGAYERLVKKKYADPEKLTLAPAEVYKISK
jgi:hypothetical protein